MTIDITQIMIILIELILVAVTTLLIPLIRSRIGEQRWELIQQYAIAGVQAAEIIFNAQGKGAEKFAWAKDYIENQCKSHGIKIDMDTVQVAIENAWKQLGFDEKTPMKTAGF